MLRFVPWLTAALVVILDRTTKLLIMRSIEPHDVREWIEVMPGLTLTHVRNPGIAFSLFSDGGPLTRILLHLVIGVAVVLIAWMLVSHSKRGLVPAIAFGLILGGAVGNLLDRIIFGWVVDFLHVWVRIGERIYTWPDFNVADSAISVGACLLILFELIDYRRHRRAEKKSGTADDAPDAG